MKPGGGFMVSKNIPNKQAKSGRRALPIKISKRNLSLGAQSWSELLRNTTTTPANPANATAICAAIPRASPGCIALD
jgi:hypothetical protein